MKNIVNFVLIVLIALNLIVWINSISLLTASQLFEIQLLNIGQGDSILIKTPENKFGLIDAGIGNKVLRELDETLPQYFKEFEFIVITHPDADHAEGFIEVLKRFKVKNVFIEKVNKASKIYDEIKSLIKEKNITNYSIHDLNDFKINEVYFDVVWPFKETNTYTDIKEPNDTSIGLVINYKNFNMFTAGDLSYNFEEAALNKTNYDVDILKVSHHGSLTSTSDKFLKLISPEVAVISVGENNRYGHPKKEILERLNNNNIKDVFRTDLSGRVSLVTDGVKLIIDTENSEPKEFGI